jgi:hypothetical protein
MRYRARRQANGQWEVQGIGDPLGIAEYIEAEATIIAFALNTVASGKDLAAVSNFKNVDGRYEVESFYCGPTDGVSPND